MGTSVGCSATAVGALSCCVYMRSKRKPVVTSSNDGGHHLGAILSAHFDSGPVFLDERFVLHAAIVDSSSDQ
ncbi:MAG: hypothetical protein DMG96_23190 [Acidobacteria bacterium]|nr:MAG: hypothetical protein DMG96_23190 [Acidobacteriota bacterium]